MEKGRNVVIVTNEFTGGWSPYDLEKGGIGGSEEAVIHLASEISAHYGLCIVYHTQPVVSDFEKAGVLYRDFSLLPDHIECDVFISFKHKAVWSRQINAPVKIHWTTEIDAPWNIEKIDYFVYISRFQKQRQLWIDPVKQKVIYLGCDLKSLTENHTLKDENPRSILYCSSPDRGLERLLKDWTLIHTRRSDLELRITYGFDIIEKLSARHPQTMQYIDRMKQLMQQPGIRFLGNLSKKQMEHEYWRATYWVHPVQKAESELFCLNAVKSKFCGAIPIVNKIGGLQETVGNYMDYQGFVDGNETLIRESAQAFPVSWETIFTEHWMQLFETKVGE